MKYKAGDTVRIRSTEWIDRQEKTKIGSICDEHGCFMTPEMMKHAAKTAHIMALNDDNDRYRLDIDSGRHSWKDWMLDPYYRPEDEPLPAEDAIRAMLSGEVLQKIGYKVEERWDGKHFVYRVLGEEKWTNKPQGGEFEGLGRKRKVRPMTRWEILAWVNSDESRGWFARIKKTNGSWGDWKYPMTFDYTCLDEFDYQRARLLPDLSGIDESTIQGFEVEK